MKLSKEEQRLVSGSEAEVDDFATDHGIHIDWRDDFDGIFDAFARLLPKGYLAPLWDGGEEIVVASAHATATVSLKTKAPPFGLEVAAALAAVLRPDYEARLFRFSLSSDTHSYFVRPRAFWDAFRTEHASRYRALFALDEESPGGYVLRLGPPEKRQPAPARVPDPFLAKARAALAKRLANAPKNAKRIAARRKAKLAAMKAAKEALMAARATPAKAAAPASSKPQATAKAMAKKATKATSKATTPKTTKAKAKKATPAKAKKPTQAKAKKPA